VDDSASRMASQLEELMDVVRLRAGQPLQLRRAPADLVELVRRTVATHQAGTQAHELSLETVIPALVGEWDHARIERVLDNVIGNAVKFSPAGGAVRVRVRTEGRGRRRAVVVTVQDSGIGIPEADLAHVFEWFRRGSNAAGKVTGTGIGLAAVRQIVEQHGGTVAVDSVEGEGSTFTIRLPLSAPPGADTPRV
jgi:signal transduction histidine kinase